MRCSQIDKTFNKKEEKKIITQRMEIFTNLFKMFFKINNYQATTIKKSLSKKGNKKKKVNQIYFKNY
jgi:hypothetical protein